MNVKVLEIKGAESYLMAQSRYDHHLKLALNGVIVTDSVREIGLSFSKSDKLQHLPSSKKLVEYRRGDEVMSVEDYQSKPQYYDDERSDEYVLRAIANKKELAGFEPHQEDPELEDVELEVVGYIEDTKSLFISCSVQGQFSKAAVLYTVNPQKIAMDEYLKLMAEYGDHARFNKPDRNYLRFVQINGEYAFNQSYPFGDYDYTKDTASLDEAKAVETEVRDMTRSAVKSSVFTKSITDEKKTQILSSLRTIKKLRTKKSMDELLSVLIKDIQEYQSNCN